jgi:hypothetical protein
MPELGMPQLPVRCRQSRNIDPQALQAGDFLVNALPQRFAFGASPSAPQRCRPLSQSTARAVTGIGSFDLRSAHGPQVRARTASSTSTVKGEQRSTMDHWLSRPASPSPAGRVTESNDIEIWSPPGQV